MFKNVLYDNDYNKQLSNSFNVLTMKKNEYGEPEIFNNQHLNKRLIGNLVGGSYGGIKVSNRRPYVNDKPLTRNDEKYIIPGITNQYPLYNMIEMRDIDNNNNVIGGNIFKDAWKGVKRFAKSKVGRKIISGALDVAPAVLGTINPTLGSVSKVAREQLKKETGYGVKSAGSVKSGGKKCKCGKGKCKCVNVNSGKKEQRAALVKKIMKEKSMTLPQASKYIKDNKLM